MSARHVDLCGVYNYHKWALDNNVKLMVVYVLIVLILRDGLCFFQSFGTMPFPNTGDLVDVACGILSLVVRRLPTDQATKVEASNPT